MSGPWSSSATQGTGPGTSGLVTIFDGSTFCVSRMNGDITGEHTEGWFMRDSRTISRWLLRVDDLELSPVIVHQPDPLTAVFLSRLPDLHVVGGASTFLVTRRRFLGERQGEHLTVWNNTSATISCTVELQVGGDLADVFEVKDGRVGPRAVRSGRPRAGHLEITRKRGATERGVTVHPSTAAQVAPGLIRWDAVVPAHGKWSSAIDVIAHRPADPAPSPASGPHSPTRHSPSSYRPSTAKATTGNRTLAATLRRSTVDLDALRIADPDRPGASVVAAGAPWYVALFGRDALLTSWMTLPWSPGLAVDSLRALSRYQGQTTE